MSFTSHIHKTLIALVMAAALVFAGTWTSHASPTDKGTDPPSESSTTERARQTLTAAEKEQIKAIGNHIAGGTLDADSAHGDPALEDTFVNDFAVGWAIGEGRVKTSSPELTRKLEQVQQHVAGSCNGRSGYRTFYPTIFLDSCQATALNALLASGAGLATVAAAIISFTGAPAGVAGVIAGALGVLTGLYGFCNSWNTGIQVFTVPGVGIPICWSQ